MAAHATASEFTAHITRRCGAGPVGTGPASTCGNAAQRHVTACRAQHDTDVSAANVALHMLKQVCTYMHVYLTLRIGKACSASAAGELATRMAMRYVDRMGCSRTQYGILNLSALRLNELAGRRCVRARMQRFSAEKQRFKISHLTPLLRVGVEDAIPQYINFP
eukprot:357663-Chlamydomonas_euryale.AAC.2